MARTSNRPGFGSVSGATNKNRTISNEAPISPNNRDEWVDTSATPSNQYYYSATYAEWRLISNTTHKVKDSNETVTSTTAQNDNDIVFNLKANSIYEIELHASAYSDTAEPDIKLVWAVTGGVSSLTARVCMGMATGTTNHTASTMRCSRHPLSTEVPYGVVASQVSCEIFEKFLVQTTTAGTLQLKWAQYTSSADFVGLSTSTFALAKKIS